MVQSGRSGASNCLADAECPIKQSQVGIIRCHDIREPEAGQTLSEVNDAAGPDRLAIEPGTGPGPGGVAFVTDRIKDSPHEQGPAVFQGQRDAKVRDSVGKIRSSVERVNDPAVLRLDRPVPLACITLFADEIVIGERGGNRLTNEFLTGEIGLGNQVSWAFFTNLGSAKQPCQHRARPARRLLAYRQKVFHANLLCAQIPPESC